jgi:predicted DNA-binding transcriptional regulator YafY
MDLIVGVPPFVLASDATERIVWPLTLVYWGRSRAPGAWCELRQSFRNFRIDRIVEARNLTTQDPDEPGKRLEDYFAQARGHPGS